MEVIIDEYKINYKESGSSDTVVIILQGWGTKLEVYDSIAACITSKYRVIQLDFPGFGNSTEPKEAWTVEDYTDFFVKFITSLNITKVILMGHSFGGRVIIKLASREDLPVVIERIILIDSAGILPKKSFSQKMRIKTYKFLKKVSNIPFIYSICPELIDDWKSKQGSEDYRNATPIMKQCLVKAVNEDLTALLPRIKAETLLIWGDMDTATPITDGQLMEKMIPESGLAVIKGAGHFCFLDQPIIFNNIIKSYLKIGV